MPPRFIARHLSHPRGFIGRIVGQLMNRHNIKLNAFAIRMLELTPSDRVLEIGLGGGATLPILLDKVGFGDGLECHGGHSMIPPTEKEPGGARARNRYTGCA